MASELTPNVSLREAAFLQPPNLATFILGQVMVAARHRRISFYKILAIAWPARKEERSSRCRFRWCTSEWHGGKKAIDDSSGEAFSIFAATTQAAADAPARKLAVDNGNNIIQLNEAQVAEWKAAAEPVYAAWVAEMDSKGIDGQALVDEARKLISEYTE